jgi:hypothetical protein
MIGANSTMALPFGTICALIGLWLLYAVGNFVGRILARRGKARAPACRVAFCGAVADRVSLFPCLCAQSRNYPAAVGELPRSVMPGPWFVQPRLAPFVGGVLPFAVMFIALHYGEAAIWTDRFYYLWGFSILTVLLVVLTAAASAIITTYFFLCWEVRRHACSLVADAHSVYCCWPYFCCFSLAALQMPHWWWLSFFTPATSGLYVFIYLIYIVAAVVKPTAGAGVFMFLVHAVIVSGSVFLALGAIGMLATLGYVWYMFSSIKID